MTSAMPSIPACVFSGMPAARPARNRPRSRGRRLLRLVLVVIALFVLWLFFVWPPVLWYRFAWPRETAFMAMREDWCSDLRRAVEQGRAGAERARELRGGRRMPLAQLCPSKRRYQPVPLEAIAKPMIRAVLIGEDNRFFEHGGIDFVELRKALGYRRDDFSWDDPKDRRDLWRAVQRTRARGVPVRGASTISQQLAKNLYLSADRSPLRKLKEALITWRLEWLLGKRRILELYLNVAEMGPGIWGVEAASQAYFGHSARTLSPSEAAALAGLLPFPLSSNPAYRPARMRWRQNLILRRMRGESVVIPSDEEEKATEGAETTEAPPDSVPAAGDTSGSPPDSEPPR